MKLCEIVFEFHQTPSATKGAAGAWSNTHPCAAAIASISSSHRSIWALSVFEVADGADGFVIGASAYFDDAHVGAVRVGIAGWVAGIAHADGRAAHAERDHFTCAGERLQ